MKFRRHRRSLLYRIKYFIETHERMLGILLVAFGIIAALALIIVGGTMAGWDFIGILTSPTALLIYAIGLTALFICGIKFIFFRGGKK